MVPAEFAKVKVAVEPEQIVDVPLMVPPAAVTLALIVNNCVVSQPDGVVYVIVAFPADTPVTTPFVLTEATLVLLDDHVPPVMLGVNVLVCVAYIVLVPVIVALGFTVMVMVCVVAH